MDFGGAGFGADGEEEMTVFGEPAVEAVARFAGETLNEITVTIYARGMRGS